MLSDTAAASVRTAPRRPQAAGLPPGVGWWDRNWLAVLALVLMVATEYKWRTRAVQESLAGQADIATLVEIGLYGLVAAYLLQFRSPVPHWGRTVPAMGWLIAYSSYAAASCAWSPYLLVAAVRAAELLVVLLLAWTAYRAAERDHFHRLAHGFLLLTTASIVLGLLVHLPQPKIQAGRFTWLAVHPTSSSVFLGISIVLLAVYLAEGAHAKGSPRWGHAWYALLLPVHLVALYVNHTRGTVAAVLVAVVVMGAQVYPRRRRVTFLVGLVWMAAFVVVTAGGALVAYVERGSTVGNLLTLNTRTNLWSVAFVAVERQPLFGSGLYASRGIFYDQTGLGGGHNAIVNVLVELGMVGTCLWLALIGATVLPLWRLRRLCSAPEVATDRLLLISVLAMLAVNGVTVAGIGGVANLSAIWLFLIVGWAAQLARRPVPPADPDENRRSTEERSS